MRGGQPLSPYSTHQSTYPSISYSQPFPLPLPHCPLINYYCGWCCVVVTNSFPPHCPSHSNHYQPPTTTLSFHTTAPTKPPSTSQVLIQLSQFPTLPAKTTHSQLPAKSHRPQNPKMSSSSSSSHSSPVDRIAHLTDGQVRAILAVNGLSPRGLSATIRLRLRRGMESGRVQGTPITGSVDARMAQIAAALGVDPAALQAQSHRPVPEVLAWIKANARH